MRTCTRCRVSKVVGDFSVRNGSAISCCRDCTTQKTRDWRAKNPDRYKIQARKNVLSKFGLTPEDYDRIVENQDSLCGLCNLPLGLDAVVDHDHACCPGIDSCGECIRSIIHRKCNAVLGMADDSVGLLKSAIEYLERNQNGTC